MGYPLCGPSRHVRAYYFMLYVVDPDFLCDDPFRHETFSPLFRRLTQFPLVLGCDRSLVGVDLESSEVVQ